MYAKVHDYEFSCSNLTVIFDSHVTASFISIADEKDLFLNKFIRFIQKESQKLSDGTSSTSESEKAATVSKNLCITTCHFCIGKFKCIHIYFLIKSFAFRFAFKSCRIFSSPVSE